MDSSVSKMKPSPSTPNLHRQPLDCAVCEPTAYYLPQCAASNNTTSNNASTGAIPVRKDNILWSNGRNTTIIEILQHTKRTSPQYDNHDKYLRNERLLENDNHKCDWIYLTKKSIENHEFLDFIKKLHAKKLKNNKDLCETLQKYLAPKLLLAPDVEPQDIPECLKEFKYVSVDSPKQMAEIIESRPNAAVQNIESIIKEEDRGPFIDIRVRLTFLVPGNNDYLRRAYNLTIEALEDSSSYPRQHLMQLHGLANVRVKRDKSNDERKELCVEIRPTHFDDFMKFFWSVVDGSLSLMLKSHVKLDGYSFTGNVDTTVKTDDVIHIMAFFNKSFVENHRRDLGRLIDQRKKADLDVLIESVQFPDTYAESTVLSLKVLLAGMLYEQSAKDPKSTPHDIGRLLKKHGMDNMLGELRNNRGQNALHMAILAGRKDFMKMLYYSNKWGVLRQDVVKAVARVENTSPRYEGYTPRRLAEALSLRNKGFEIFQKFDKLDGLWVNLPLLHRACVAGRLDYVSLMVETDHSIVLRTDGIGSTCLLYACANGNKHLVQYLLNKEVPRNRRNKNDESALHFAAMFGHTELLIEMSKFDFDIRGKRNKFGYCAIDYCAINGDLESIKMYQEKRFPIGLRALTAAAKHGQLEVVKYLVQDTNLNLSDEKGKDEEGRTAVHYAVINGSKEMLKILLEKGINITLKDRYNRNVFHLGAEHSRTELVQLLIKHAQKKDLESLLNERDYYLGKNLLYVVRGKDRGRRAWHWIQLRRLSLQAFKTAMSTGQIDVVKYGKILKSGFGPGPDEAAVEEMKKKNDQLLSPAGRKEDQTPLHIAVTGGNKDIVELFLENGAQPDTFDHTGTAAVHLAAMMGDIAAMLALERYNADVELVTRDERPRTPGQIAEENGNLSVINFIQSRSTIEKAREFCQKTLIKKLDSMKEERLEAKRLEGQDIRRYLIEELRDLTIDVNVFLMALGSGPVLEESEPTPAVYNPVIN